MTSVPPSARLRTSGIPSRPSTPTTRDTSTPPSFLRSASLTRVNSSGSSISSLFGTLSINSPSSGADDPRSLICRAFVPHVAVHVSDDTNALAREKGFSCFQELLRPYGEDLQGRLTVRDSQGLSNSYDDFGVRFVALSEVAAGGEHWESGMSHGANGTRESIYKNAEAKVYLGGNVEEVEELIKLKLDRHEAAGAGAGAEEEEEGGNFYNQYLCRLLSALPVAPHETFSHPVACVIAISSRNSAPIETMRNLYTEGTQVPVPGYVNPDYLRYYVLVHDEDRDDISK